MRSIQAGVGKITRPIIQQFPATVSFISIFPSHNDCMDKHSKYTVDLPLGCVKSTY